MIDYSRELKEQFIELRELLTSAKKRKKRHAGLPEGSLRITASNGSPQYYFREKDAEKSSYVHAKDREIIPKLIQAEYDEKILKALEEACHNFERFLNNYNPRFLDEIYDKLCKARKEFVSPITLSDEAFINQWMEKIQGEQNPYPKQVIYETEQGEKVRSKSEKILADTFYKMKIPYCYEPKVLLNGFKGVYPDFACLNARTRKTFYWEHLGLLSEEEYATKNFEKMATYEKCGILLGGSLIISMETAEQPLDIAVIRKKIERFLK